MNFTIQINMYMYMYMYLSVVHVQQRGRYMYTVMYMYVMYTAIISHGAKLPALWTITRCRTMASCREYSCTCKILSFADRNVGKACCGTRATHKVLPNCS